MIAISISPNTEAKDYFIALKLLVSPWCYLRGKSIKKVEEWFKKYFKVAFAISFDSARSAQYLILSSLGIGKGDEVLIQAFTCVAVPNSVLWSGAKPIYVDIDKSFNMDPQDLERKITKNSRAIIVQHTFGIAAKIAKIKEIARENKLVLIEDCAHSLGGTLDGKKLGTFGDVSFFSFGRDKVISSVFGGMAITNNKVIGNRLSRLQKNLPFPGFFWVAQQLLHPVLFSIILPIYNLLNIGKVILKIAQELHLLSIPVSEIEKKGGKPRFYPKKLPNSLATLALIQLDRLDKFNRARRAIARVYSKEFGSIDSGENIFLRFPILVGNPSKLINFAKKQGILLGRWYSHIIDPEGVDLKKVEYITGSCPVAQNLAAHVVNLPTYPRMRRIDVERVVETIKDFHVKS